MKNKSNWEYEVRVETCEGGPEDGMEDAVTVAYSARTPGVYYLTVHSSSPLDKWGADWEKTEQCIIIDKDDISNLIDQLKEIKDIEENPAKAVLYGKNKV